MASEVLAAALPGRYMLYVLGLVCGYMVYCLALGIYRIYFSPLSKFPGPRLAAVSQWYETYFEIFHRGGGMFTKQIKMLHEHYGPIVRINPWELHIDDPEYFETIYASSAPYDKLQMFENRFNIPRATFSTVNHGTHRHRRAALTPFFTKSKIKAHGPFIQTLVGKICSRLASEYSGKAKPVTLNDMFACLSGDVITQLAFAKDYDLCSSENWETPFTKGMTSLLASTHLTAHFSWVIPFMNCIPDRVMALSKLFAPIIELRHELDRRIREVFEKRASEKAKGTPPSTVFEFLLDSKLPAHELVEERLQHEAVSIIGAAFDTTRQALTTTCFHIIANPRIYERLHQELTEAIPDPLNLPAWEQLQQLPYLSACIEEGLRIGFGTVQRSPRISRDSEFHYNGYIIPRGTPISEDTYHMHTNETIFPDSSTYKPERWLGDPKGPDGVKQLSRYMVAFSRGARMCLGMQMAYCEMFIMLATMMRQFDFSLYETDRSDVDFYSDALTPQTKPGSLGVRVLVK